MFKFDPETNAITMTMTITWEDTVSRCWHHYHNALDDAPFPGLDKLTAEEKSAIMQAVTDELDYQEPEGWSGILNIVDQAVREYIDGTYEFDDDILSDCINWTDYADQD